MSWAATRLGSSPAIITAMNLPIFFITSSSLLHSAHTPRERARHRHFAVYHLQRQCRPRPRSRSTYDMGSILRVELRRVARADKVLGLGLPPRNFTPGMCTDGGIADDALGRDRAGGLR